MAPVFGYKPSRRTLRALGAKLDLRDPDQRFCKGIYAGCCIIADSRCEPCERIARGKSTVEKEMALKRRRERR